MEITISQEKGRRPVTVFHVTGEINSNTYQEFEQKARVAYNAGMRDLLVDLAKCEYVSSAGIRALSSIQTMLRTDAPEGMAESQEETDLLLASIHTLPDDRQQLLILKFVERLSNSEVGEIMGRTEGAVKSLYHRTLLSLRDEIGDQIQFKGE